MDKQFDVAVVHWHDSTCRSGWHSMKEMPPAPDPCLTVGVVVYRGRRHITLAQSLSDRDQQSEAFVIPRSCIEKIEIVAKVSRPTYG